MGMNTILMLIMGIAMTAIIGSQVAPSMIEQIKATKVEAKSINNQEVIFEAVKRYITMKQKNPDRLQDIIDEQFLNAKVNDNGFGGGYEIEIVDSKGLLKIKTTIEDSKAQEIFLNSFKNKFIPTRVGTTNEFETTFVIPTDIMHGRGLFMTGIPVQATPPTDTSLKYWYDTSGIEVALRMYDPNSNTWKKVAGTSGSGSISGSALVDASGDIFTKDTLQTTVSEFGEIKYAYDSETNSIQEFVYMGSDKGWVAKGGVNESSSPDDYMKFIAGNLLLFNYSYTIPYYKYTDEGIQYENPNYNSSIEKTFIEIIPSKSGSININSHTNSYFSDTYVYINGEKVEHTIIKSTQDIKHTIFFKAGDKIELKTTYYSFILNIYVSLESVGLYDLKITKFNL